MHLYLVDFLAERGEKRRRRLSVDEAFQRSSARKDAERNYIVTCERVLDINL